jgi:Tol biopolymer transport system component
MNFASDRTRAQFVTKNHQSSGYAMTARPFFCAANVTKRPQSSGDAMRAVRLLAILLLALLCSAVALGDGLTGDGDWAIFVSQRAGATELYLINLDTHQVSQLTNTGRGHLTPATAAGARVVAFASREGSNYELFVAQISSDWRTRRPLLAAINRLTVDTMDQTNPTLSGDGNWMAFASGQGVELMSTTGLGRRVLVASSTDHSDFAPAISPNGREVAFISNRSGANEIWLANTTTGEVRQLTQGAAALGGLSWSSDSQNIVFTTDATASKLSGIAIASAASGSFRVLTQEGDGEASFSPNGTRVIFTSLRDGDPELYLLNLNTSAVERLTKNSGVDGAAVFVSAPASPIRRTPPSRRISFVNRNRK